MDEDKLNELPSKKPSLWNFGYVCIDSCVVICHEKATEAPTKQLFGMTYVVLRQGFGFWIRARVQVIPL